MQFKKVDILYYSGTGGTERVATAFEHALRKRGAEVYSKQFKAGIQMDNDCGLVILLYAVHAFNAPEGVYQWLDAFHMKAGTPVVVCSVSGGGDVSPNTASRVHLIKRLNRKGYKVIYEKMLVMPSNWIIPTKPVLAKKLLEILPQKVEQILEDISNDIQPVPKILWIDRFLSILGEFEKIGAHYFGRKIIVSGDCNGCSWCVNHCPAINIYMEDTKPIFGKRCHMCLGCIYGCPQKALTPGMGKFVVIKQGFNLHEIEKLPSVGESINVNEEAKGYLWSGIRKYLDEKS